jgi:hypothetical protein
MQVSSTTPEETSYGRSGLTKTYTFWSQTNSQGPDALSLFLLRATLDLYPARMPQLQAPRFSTTIPNNLGWKNVSPGIAEKIKPEA